jgi:hypothetical protein
MSRMLYIRLGGVSRCVAIFMRCNTPYEVYFNPDVASVRHVAYLCGLPTARLEEKCTCWAEHCRPSALVLLWDNAAITRRGQGHGSLIVTLAKCWKLIK